VRGPFAQPAKAVEKAGMITIATWNINSVRLRTGSIARFAAEANVDVICLQEIKCRDGEFPAAAFRDMGFKHLHVVGQKGWHGVAIASRIKLEPLEAPPLCPKKEARVAAARIDGVEIHNLYVPAGADIPDPTVNEKFAHKLDVLARMRRTYRKRKGAGPLIIVGDLNVAPGEHDVWSHKQLLDVAYANGDDPSRRGSRRGRLCRLGSSPPSDARKALQLVELPVAGLDKKQSRAAARSYLGEP
jgi:exodeoxyribonuclease III